MNRREILQSLLAIPFVSRLRPCTETSKTVHPGIYGFMDVDRWFAEGHFGKRILCNGIEPKETFAFHDGEGWVDCYALDEYGHAHLEPGTDQLKTVRYYGVITVEPKANNE